MKNTGNFKIMEEYMLSLRAQIPKAISIGRTVAIPKSYRNVSNVLFCGMGGSAIGGDILRTLFTSRSKLPFFTYRSDHPFPKWVSGKTLVVLSSYSGNTKEILNAHKNAAKCRAKCLVLSSGGKLALKARSRNLPLVRIPAGFPPRCAIGYLTFSLVPILEKIGRFSVTEKEIRETISEVRKVSRAKALALARKMKSRSVRLYATAGLMEPAALRWRTQLEENAKMLASHHVLPEMFHNEIQGWENPVKEIRRSTALFFKDRDDTKELQSKRRFAVKHIGRQKARTFEIMSKGRSPLARLFSLIALGDWVSFEVARLTRVDPIPIPVLEAIKKIK